MPAALQADDSGAWLWCSRDDWVIDAIRKVGGGAGAAQSPSSWEAVRRLGPPRQSIAAMQQWRLCIAKRAAQRAWEQCARQGAVIAAPPAPPRPATALQMTHANVGSLVVFDPSKIQVCCSELQPARSPIAGAIAGARQEHRPLQCSATRSHSSWALGLLLASAVAPGWALLQCNDNCPGTAMRCNVNAVD